MINDSKAKPTFHYLNQETVQAVKVSDHHPMIVNNILTWNIMMQARFNALKNRFNNGFAIPTESKEQYQARLKNIVRVISEILSLNPNIDIIALQEAPIKKDDIKVIINEFDSQDALKKFRLSITLDSFTKMGIATFFNAKKYCLKSIKHTEASLPSRSLVDKFRGYRLQERHSKKQHGFYNLHLPYDLAKKSGGFKLLVPFIKALSHSLNDMTKTFVGDFNFDPTKLLTKLSGFKGFIPQKNNVHLSREKIPFKETVDGVLTTSRIKTCYRDAKNSSLFFKRHVSVKPIIERAMLDKIEQEMHKMAVILR